MLRVTPTPIPAFALVESPFVTGVVTFDAVVDGPDVWEVKLKMPVSFDKEVLAVVGDRVLLFVV
jgi:hypothetical protein